MKRFLKNIFFFALPVLLFLVALECYMRSLPNEYRYKAQWMEQHADSVQTIVLGSSKAYYGFRPDCFASYTFNLATISGRPDYDAFLLEKYIHDTPQLNTVIYSVFYEFFFDPPFEQCVEWPRASYYKIYWDCPKHPCWSKYNCEISSLFAVRTKLDDYQLYGGEICDSLGYGLQTNTKYKNNDWNLKKAVEIDVKRHTARDFRYEKYNYQYLKKIAELCKQHHLRLILVSMPCMKEYVEQLDKKQYNEFIRLTHKISKEYQLEFFDFINHPAFCHDDFFDTNHLNENGSKKLSSMMDAIVNS